MEKQKKKFDQHVGTWLGAIVLVIIAITVGVLAWKVIRDREVAEAPQNVVNVKKPVTKQTPVSNDGKQSINSASEGSYVVNPEEPKCNNKSNMINWDGSRNGYYYTKGSNYFTFSYPCDYKISFTDTTGFYSLSKTGNIEERIIISKSLYANEKINGIKQSDARTYTEVLNKKLNIGYPYKVYNVKVDAGYSCGGDCVEYPGRTYNGIEIKISDNLYFHFQADSSVDEKDFFNMAESFAYHVVK